jgi:hypothetical protein
MANHQTTGAVQASDQEQTKRELQRQMQRTRESLAETVDEIKHTVEQEIATAKQTVSGVLDYREQFKNEPLVWSLGALSAGFALGYTLGYARTNSKAGKHPQLSAFTQNLIDELSTAGNTLVMPALNGKIRELFGFDFQEVLAEIGQPHKRKTKTVGRKRAGRKTARGKTSSPRRTSHTKRT